MERLNDNRATGLSRGGLRGFGVFFIALGIISRSILQLGLLDLTNVTPMALLEAMQGSEITMVIATLALVLQAMETCALPIFAFLLLEGWQKTTDRKAYAIRLLGLALLTEIHYNLAMSGKVLDLSSRNPIFGLVLAMVLLWFFQRYRQPGFKNRLIQVLLLVAAALWTVMLTIDHGLATVVALAAMYAFRTKPMFRGLAGAVAVTLCTAQSLFYLAAPMSFLILHFYNEEPGSDNRAVNYLAYPVLLLALGLVGKFAM